MATIGIVVMKLTTGTEVERILEALEEKIGVRGEPVENRVIFKVDAPSADDATVSMQQHLDGISETWPIHLRFAAAG